MEKTAVFHILLKHPQVISKLADIIVKYSALKEKFVSALSKLLDVLAVTVCTQVYTTSHPSGVFAKLKKRLSDY